MIIDTPVYEVVDGVFRAEEWKNRKLGIPTTCKKTITLGLYNAIGPMLAREVETDSNQFCKINMTSQPGICSNLMYKFLFQIPKWGFGISKIDEFVEVNPTHREYYDRTVAMKDQLANQIKQGLAQASNAVSDFELVNHDLRKYKEIMTYFNEKTEHSLKAMFIDQVDVHNGNMSMVQIVARWATLIHDFQQLDDKDTDIDKIAKKLNVPKAEAVVLKTKNLLYIQWKKLFRTAAIQRYERLITLAKAREKSISEYRKWLKPYIVRFARLRVGHSIEKVRHKILKSYVDITGQLAFSNYSRFWIYKYFKPIEMRRAGREKMVDGKWVIEPYDDFVRENFVIHPTKGLAALYPWLLGPYDPTNDKVKPHRVYADFLMDKIKKTVARGDMAPFCRSYYMYYNMVDIEIPRNGIRTPAGELEDIDFLMKNWMISQNIMFIKLLEMRCREIQLNKYVDSLLGLNINEQTAGAIAKKEFPNVYGKKSELVKMGFDKMWEEAKNKVNSVTGWVNRRQQDITRKKVPGKFMFFKPGPYEFDFTSRIGKGYLVPFGRYYHGVLEGFLKKEMGVY